MKVIIVFMAVAIIGGLGYVVFQQHEAMSRQIERDRAATEERRKDAAAVEAAHQAGIRARADTEARAVAERKRATEEQAQTAARRKPYYDVVLKYAEAAVQIDQYEALYQNQKDLLAATVEQQFITGKGNVDYKVAQPIDDQARLYYKQNVDKSKEALDLLHDAQSLMQRSPADFAGAVRDMMADPRLSVARRTKLSIFAEP